MDLFEQPQVVRHLDEIMERLGRKEKTRDIAAAVGVKLPIIHEAKKLRRLLDESGQTDPYVAVTSPDGLVKIARHKHPRYKAPTSPKDLSGGAETARRFRQFHDHIERTAPKCIRGRSSFLDPTRTTLKSKHKPHESGSTDTPAIRFIRYLAQLISDRLVRETTQRKKTKS